MHTILAILLSDYVFYITLALSVITSSSGFYSDDKVSGIAVFLFIVFLGLCGINYYTVITLPQLFVAVPLYLFAGLLWSIVKWKMYIKKKIIAYNEKCAVSSAAEAKVEVDREGYYTRQREQYLTDLQRDTSIANSKSHIKSWIGFWPVSLAISCTYDIIDNIYTYCSGIYRKAVENAFASAKIPTA